MPEVVVVASIKAKPGKEDDTRAALEALVVPTHADDGCILYSLHQGAEDPARFAFVERWESPELLQAHLGTDHIAAVLAQADELLSEPPDIVTYAPVPAGEDAKGTLAGHAAG